MVDQTVFVSIITIIAIDFMTFCGLVISFYKYGILASFGRIKGPHATLCTDSRCNVQQVLLYVVVISFRSL